ncbi:Lon protease C-terminal proteolytic domain-containing protein [Blastocladiella britannica]|nr:Lon protease C-terminal proteolytic domain-containing protein [Blastocladiella britannica]
MLRSLRLARLVPPPRLLVQAVATTSTTVRLASSLAANYNHPHLAWDTNSSTTRMLAKRSSSSSPPPSSSSSSSAPPSGASNNGSNGNNGSNAPAAAGGANSNDDSNGNGNSNGKDDDDPPARSLQTLSPPDTFTPVLALPITRRPLFPGFYKTVVIKDPQVIDAMKEVARSQHPYVVATLLKDEDADTDTLDTLDEAYRVGVFCQLTNIYHSTSSAATAMGAADADGGPSLTAILYPHKRVRVTDLIHGKGLGPSPSSTGDDANSSVIVDPASTAVVPPPSTSSSSTTAVSSSGADAGTHTKKPKSARATKLAAKQQQQQQAPPQPESDTSPQAYLASKYRVSLVRTESIVDEPYKRGNQLIRALTSEIVAVFKDIATLNPLFREQIAAFSVSQSSATIFDDPSRLADFAAAVSGGSDAEELQGVLDSLVIEERLQKALYVLKKELVNAQLQSKISKEVESKIQKRQREYFLTEQLKGIKKELGLESDGKDKLMEKFKARLETLTLPPAVQIVVDEELNKLSHLDPNSSEMAVTRNYLDWLTCLPWGRVSKEDLDVERARTVLDEDHYGLKDVKDRILEFIAVGKLKGTVQGKIICLSGPPGVGKTSIGKSIARALNREFFRFSVGGLSDVAEIKGHRRTYVGAMPGKIVQALKKVQTENCLILIDEIDKLGRGHQGDPASALLELLDPEQNSAFLDHYLDVPLDLSKVLFVCTANVTETIPAPLLDRMEIIQLSGYVADEKIAIAERYLVPQAKKACGLVPEEPPALVAEPVKADGESAGAAPTATPVATEETATETTAPPPPASSTTTTEVTPHPVPVVELTQPAIEDLIRYYCRESGVRRLKQHVEKIFRKAAFKVVTDPTTAITIDAGSLKDYVGNPPFEAERMYPVPPAGVIMGLAWTAMGGSALYIESVADGPLADKGKPALKCTGQLGDVMKESTTIAYTYAKSYLAERFPDLPFFRHGSVHLHVPGGAVPKDGPSAGVTMTTSLISLASHTPVPGHIAMTGELTLTGKVLKIGGLKEKTIAAKRSGITTILFPAANKADWDELPDFVRAGITGVPVDWYSDVFEACFGDVVRDGSFAKNAWRLPPPSAGAAVPAAADE